jgi:hypothetical protein
VFGPTSKNLDSIRFLKLLFLFELEQFIFYGASAGSDLPLRQWRNGSSSMIKEEKIDEKTCMCSVFSFVRFRNIGPDSASSHMLTNHIQWPWAHLAPIIWGWNQRIYLWFWQLLVWLSTRFFLNLFFFSVGTEKVSVTAKSWNSRLFFGRDNSNEFWIQIFVPMTRSCTISLWRVAYLSLFFIFFWVIENKLNCWSLKR